LASLGPSYRLGGNYAVQHRLFEDGEGFRSNLFAFELLPYLGCERVCSLLEKRKTFGGKVVRDLLDHRGACEHFGLGVHKALVIGKVAPVCLTGYDVRDDGGHLDRAAYHVLPLD